MNDFRESPTAFRGPFDRAYTRLSTSTRMTPLDETPAPIQEEIPISQLPLAGLIFGDEMVPLVQNGVTARTSITSIAIASGGNPSLINKTVTLVYSAQVGQADFSLSLPDHFGNSYPLSISNALHVTVDGVRFIEDDGSGSFGNYTVNIGSNTVTLLVPLGGGNDVVFDVFNINVQDVTLDSAINTQPLIVTAPNTLSSLAFVPNGSMTIIYVNGRAFSDDSIPPSFTVTGQLITWVDPLISIAPGDEVIAAYTYNGPGGGGGGGGGGSGIPEPPADGTLYGRENSNWQHISHTDIQDWGAATAAFAPLNSPAFTGTPSLPSGAVGVTATPGDNSAALATTAFVASAFTPSPSTTPPLMDGAAAPGMSLAWSRGDHVHPSDTSRAPAVTGGYLALSGGAMAGPLTVLAPTIALQAANKQYVDNLRVNDNLVINGNFAVNQRAYATNTALAAAAYGHDRWKAGASGCTYTFTTATPDTIITITAGTLTQVIEAGMIAGGTYTLSWTGSAQARVYQGSPTGSYAASPITALALTAGTNSLIEFNAGTVGQAKLEIGTVATPFNRPSLAKVLADCQRYYQSHNGLMVSGYNSTGNVVYGSFLFPVQMRAAPSVSITGNTSLNASGVTLNAINPDDISVVATITATGMGWETFLLTLSAEL